MEKSRKFNGQKIDSKPIDGDNDKNIKVKISTYGDKISTIFHNNKEPKQNET